jgi:Sulfatase
LWIVPLLLYFAYGVRPHPYARPQMHAASDKRIVWILFDELSYKLVFEQPPERMQFPNFDVLRAESVSLGDIHPPGFRTDEIIPSVLLGKKIDAIRSNFSRKLIYLDETSHQWMPYDKNRSLFRLAQSAGWNSGVAGWYNPYCRIFGSLLDACFWEPGEFSKLPLEKVGASEDKSALENASILVRVLLLDHVPTREELFASQVATYSTLMKHAEQLIRNEQLNFVFIHLPLPHPPGYYDRRTHRLCACGNYLDNLVLADDTMGELAKTINQTHEADQTILIISSDHSWRVPIWATRTYWTPEEQRISQGQYDSRAVFLVHFPGQKSAIDVPGTYSEVAEYDIIASMLQHKTNSPDDLVSFLRRPQPSSQSSQLAQH